MVESLVNQCGRHDALLIVGVATWSGPCLPKSTGSENSVWCCITESRMCFSASDSYPFSKWTPLLPDLEGDTQ